jgi:hypothetical protein
MEKYSTTQRRQQPCSRGLSSREDAEDVIVCRARAFHIEKQL